MPLLAYIPSWWKNLPSLVWVGSACPPAFTLSTITSKGVVYVSAKINSPYFYSTPICTLCAHHTAGGGGRLVSTLIIKKIKFSSYIRKFRMEQLQSHTWLTASSHMVKHLRISSYIRQTFLIYDFTTAPFCIYLYMRKILFYFSQWGKWGGGR